MCTYICIMINKLVNNQGYQIHAFVSELIVLLIPFNIEARAKAIVALEEKLISMHCETCHALKQFLFVVALFCDF